MRIGVAQINTRPGDLESIADRMVSLSEQGLDQGVDLLVFPLACLTGPIPLSETDQDDFLVDAMEMFASLARRAACPCVVPVVSDLNGETLPEAMLIRDGRVLPLRLSAYAGSSRGRGAGGAVGMPPFVVPRFEIGGMRFAVAFTYDDLEDLGEPGHGADAVIFISGYGYASDDPSSARGAALSENRYVGDARALGAWLVGVGSVGGYGTQVFTGSSFVLSPTGELVDSAPGFGDALMVSDLSSSSDHRERALPEVYDKPLFLWQSLSLGMRDYVHKLGMRHVLLALDGTLSSMVCAALASDALGPTNVHVVVDAPASVEREAACQRLARNLRLDVREAGDLPLLPKAGDDADLLLRRGVVEAYLASWAAELGGMVLSTLDKTALALGSFSASPSSAVL
jgi:NAD+ synthase (glutamine-hydrolysing)